jgi:hypothetical protein
MAIQLSFGSQLDTGVQLTEHLLGEREVLRGNAGRSIRLPRDDGFR